MTLGTLGIRQQESEEKMAAAGWSRLAGLLPFVIASLLYASLSAVAGEAAPQVAYHYSTINALLRDFYDGDMTIADLARHGDHGLGTVNGLDGELIIVDGTPYQMRADGSSGGCREARARLSLSSQVSMSSGRSRSPPTST